MLGLVLILGGLALFLFGISMLSSGMEKLTGDQIQQWLEQVTNSRLKSTIFGTVATALIQSSGLLMVTMIGLINANLMTVEQAIGVMLGQEIGTTLTAQVVAFDIGAFRLILVVAGILLLEFFPQQNWKKFGEILMGLGIIFVGMSYMSDALEVLIEIPWVAGTLEAMGQRPWVGVIAGVLTTAVTQSSTAVTSMTVAMGMSEAITLRGAVGIILGANIGSCVTGLIAALRLSNTARQASIAQIMINVIGVLIFLPLINPYASLIELTSANLPRQIANAHTIFNVTVSLLMFPFVRQIAALARKIFPTIPEKEIEKVTAYIDEAQYAVPAVALKEASRELYRLGEVTCEMIELSCHALIDLELDKAELERFIMTLMRSDLEIKQQARSFQMKNLLVDIERVGDMAEDIAQFAQERASASIPFTGEAIEELKILWESTHEIYHNALVAFRDGDRELAEKVQQAEKEFDSMYMKARQRHIRRMENGMCHPEANVIFTETLRLLERICDHADNLGVSVARN
jgi:phosphate:Na+ symporter